MPTGPPHTEQGSAGQGTQFGVVDDDVHGGTTIGVHHDLANWMPWLRSARPTEVAVAGDLAESVVTWRRARTTLSSAQNMSVGSPTSFTSDGRCGT